ncbi:hypothetical protein A0H76_975 [Hepatospora eriocheir]|uniref:Uncharacterized protein n=1 Tax=Hepatospora eriocheir TaxID=1081669 RepID=A0A1X0QKX6_9MICR|nr:hypothetical protein A0H76_975 [Hepatospora eriocheir]
MIWYLLSVKLKNTSNNSTDELIKPLCSYYQSEQNEIINYNFLNTSNETHELDCEEPPVKRQKINETNNTNEEITLAESDEFEQIMEIDELKQLMETNDFKEIMETVDFKELDLEKAGSQ